MIRASIIVPTLNEAANIGPLLNRLEGVLDNFAADCEIIFVDNGSDDGTADEIRRYAFSEKVKLYNNQVNEGLAKAILAGVEQAQNENIVVMDGDLSHPPEAIPDLLTTLVNENFDMVIGSRYTKGGSTPDWPLYRRLMSKAATVPARLFSDVHDPLAGFFAVKKKFLIASQGKVRGFKLGFELLALDEEELKVCELPIEFHDRVDGDSKMCGSVIVEYFKQLIQSAGGDIAFAANPRLISTVFSAIGLDFLISYFLLEHGSSIAASHMTGFTLSCLLLYGVTRCWHVKNVIDGAPFIQSRFTRLLLLCLFTTALRGGFIACQHLVFGVPFLAALSVAIVLSHLLNYFGYVLFVFPGRYFRFNKLINWRIFSLVVFVYFIVLRLLFLGPVELLEEEAYYWNYSQHMDIGFLDHPPMVACLIWLGTFVFGNVEFGVRIGGVLAYLLAVFFVYRLTSSSHGRSAALCSLLLMSVFPFYFGTAIFMTPDAPLTACWAGTLYFLYRVLVMKKTGSWFGVAVFLGLGMLSKYTIVLLGPAIVLYMLFDADSRKWFVKPNAYITAISAFIIFSPVIIWNYQNEWASFMFQSAGRVNKASVFSTHELLGSILVLISPAAFLSFLHFLVRGRKYTDQTVSEIPWKRQYLFFLLMTLAPLAVFTLFSFTKEVKFNWTGPLWLAIIPYCAWTVIAATRYVAKDKFLKVVQRTYPTVIMIFAAVVAFLPHYLSLGLPGVPYIQGTQMGGWSDLAMQVEERVVEHEMENGTRPIVVGMDKYQIASSLAFYRTKLREQGKIEGPAFSVIDETSAWSVLGFKGLMYGYWFTDPMYQGRDMLLISSSERRMKVRFPQRWGYAKDYDESEIIVVSKNGIPFGKYYSRFIKEYTRTGREYYLNKKVDM